MSYFRHDKSRKNNPPVYAHATKILQRNISNYETVVDPDEKSHYSEMEFANTNRPQKTENLETDYVKVLIPDNTYDEPAPKRKGKRYDFFIQSVTI